MIKSMTGFASLTRDDEAATIAVTVRVGQPPVPRSAAAPAAVAGGARVAAPGARPAARGARPGRGDGHRAAAPGAGARSRAERAVSRGARRARSTGRASAGYIAGAMTPGDLLRFPQALSIRERPRRTRRRTSRRRELRRASRRRSRRRSTSSTRCGRARAASCAPTSTPGAQQLGELFERVARRRRSRRSTRCARGSSERVKELRADALADEATGRAGDREVRRPLGHHRGSRPVPRPPRALAGA